MSGEHLIEKIVRLRIRESQYWKQHCFGLTADLLVDRAVELNCLGGVASETNKPTPFLCLLLKMLAIQPDWTIVAELVNNAEYKYMRCLGALYVRMVGVSSSSSSSAQVYAMLDPLLADYRKLSVHQRSAWETSTVDQFVHALLTQNTCFDIALPHLARRHAVRTSALREEYLALYPAPFTMQQQQQEEEEEIKQ